MHLSKNTLDFVTPTSVFAMGHPKEIKNKAGHKAGGDRTSLCMLMTREKNKVSISSFTMRGAECPHLHGSCFIESRRPSHFQ
jgi:hypothetical protein